MMDEKLLKILCCPETRQALQPAADSVITDINKQITARTLRNKAGKLVDQIVDGGFVRVDGRVLYPIRNGIPVLLIDEALPLER